MSQAVIDKHYTRLAKDYDKYLYYSPEFVRALTSKMIEKLQLQPEHRMVDLGCGTGMYSLDILKQVPLQEKIVAVDPYPQMLAGIPEDAPLEKIAEDALTFSGQDRTYDRMLIKETVHHIDDRPKLFANIFQRLTPGGILLLVHVPPKVQYPLFDKALKRAENWHADPDELVEQLKTAGFQVERDTLDYRHALPKGHYFAMVKTCYMSVLTSFEGDELAAGLEEMTQRYADQNVLKFIDHFDYLTATKPT